MVMNSRSIHPPSAVLSALARGTLRHDVVRVRRHVFGHRAKDKGGCAECKAVVTHYSAGEGNALRNALVQHRRDTVIVTVVIVLLIAGALVAFFAQRGQP